MLYVYVSFSFPFFNSPDTVTSPQETTEATHVEIVTRKYSTTVSPNEKGNLKYKDIVDEIVMKLILAGVLIPITILCILCILRVIYIRKGKTVNFGFFLHLNRIIKDNFTKNMNIDITIGNKSI